MPSSSSLLISSLSAFETDNPRREDATPQPRIGGSSGHSKYDDLLSWLESKGATISPKLQVRPSSRGGGFGAFLSESVEVDELLFTVPRAACVTLKDATSDPDCGKVFSRLIEKAGPGGKTVVLAGFLARERLKYLEDTGKDEITVSADGFGPYIATLPWERGINDQEHILYWSDDEIESQLKGSLCYSESKSLREEVSLATKVLNSILSKSIRIYRGEQVDSGFKWPWEVQPAEPEAIVDGLSEAVIGAFVSVLTRAFEDGDDDEEKMVPLLDMLQHSDYPNVSHVMRKADGTVEVRARQVLAAGEELLNQYRPELEESMPYHRFFSRFGFVPGIQEPIQNLLQDKSSIFFAQKAEI